MQGKLADMYTTAAAARSLVHATARAADAHAASPRRLRRDCAAAILFAAEAATRVALDGIQVLGGNGYINECAPAAPSHAACLRFRPRSELGRRHGDPSVVPL